MSALATFRDTPVMAGLYRDFPVKAAVKIWPGALVVIDSNGRAAPATTATGLIAVGRAEALADNAAGANDAINVRVRAGIFRWGNSASSDEIARSDIGSTVYIVDDQTVAKTDDSSSRSAAGRVWDVDALGVWVATGLA